MIAAAARGIQREAPLGDLAHEHFVAWLQIVEQRR